jgi:hypothetical protein
MVGYQHNQNATSTRQPSTYMAPVGSIFKTIYNDLIQENSLLLAPASYTDHGWSSLFQLRTRRTDLSFIETRITRGRLDHLQQHDEIGSNRFRRLARYFNPQSAIQRTL